MLRRQALVMQDITAKKPGRLKYQGTFWFGRATDPSKTYKAGQLVEISFREGNTWFVIDTIPMMLPR